MRQPRKDLQEKIAVAEKALLEALSDPSEQARQDVRRVSELKCLCDEYRALALSGGEISAADLLKFEQLYAEARKVLGIPDKPPVNHKLTIRYVGGSDCPLNALSLPELEELIELKTKLDTLPDVDCPESTRDALEQLGSALGKIAELRARCSTLEGQLAAAEHALAKATAVPEQPTSMLEILPPAPQEQRQLPPPPQPDEPVNIWASVLGGGPVPWNSRDGYTRRFD